VTPLRVFAMPRLVATCLPLLALALAAPAQAHHSFAMFDKNKTVTIKGTIKEIHWKNPHVWIDVAPEKGGEAWEFETGNTNTLIRAGWKRADLKVGDKIIMVANPLRNGETAGSLVSLTLPSGKVLTNGAQGKKAEGY
jgi:hypothetical protein